MCFKELNTPVSLNVSLLKNILLKVTEKISSDQNIGMIIHAFRKVLLICNCILFLCL